MELFTLRLFTLAVLFGFLPEASLLKNSALYCHQCIAFSCTNELTLCASAREFVRRQLPLFYHIGSEYPQCPEPDAVDDWERMKNTYPSSTPCQQAIDGEATCLLGRFRVLTHITESNINVSSHGTVLGCGKRELLSRIANDLVDPQDKETETTFHSIRGCHSDEISSPVKNSLKHFFELEHCSQPSDMCHDKSFCIEPQLSIVKPFQDTEYDTYVPMSIFIWVGIALAVLIAIVTFLGIRYN
jgi:hypothetical protein